MNPPPPLPPPPPHKALKAAFERTIILHPGHTAAKTQADFVTEVLTTARAAVKDRRPGTVLMVVPSYNPRQWNVADSGYPKVCACVCG